MEIVFGLLVFLVTFFITVFLVSNWIKKARSIGLVGKDMNKHNKPEIPEAGGIAFLLGTTTGIFFYIFLKTFYFHTNTAIIEIFALTVTILLAGFLGFLDDVLGWKKGLKRWQKPLLTVPIGIPLAVVNAGQSVMNVPFFGVVDFGIIYPLVIVPLGIVLAANGFNMLAGYNGLEAGMGLIILSALGLISWKINSNLWLATVCFIASASLLAFLVFNWYPAKIFPGDSLTYAVGALIAAVAILGNMEKIAIILFIPFISDALLSLIPEAMGESKKEAFGKPNPDGSLEMPYPKIYGLEHLGLWIVKKIKRKAYERDVTLFFLFVELVLVALVWVVYF